MTYILDGRKPQTMIYPPQLWPELLVVHDESNAFCLFSTFDAQSVAENRELKANFTDETIFVTINDAKLALPQQLLVFYTMTTRSIPPQAPISKVILFPNGG